MVQALYVWPRLGPLSFAPLLDDMRGSTLEDLSNRVELIHHDVTYYPTGRHVPEAVVHEVAEIIRTNAVESGWPKAASEAGRGRSFDQKMAGPLYKAMRIVPADAAHPGVWAHLALVVAPDVAYWRYAGAHDERFISTDRNVFGRLWWRAHRLGAERADPPTKLGEDQQVAILERPSLGGRPRLAKMLAEAVAAHPRGGQDLMRMAAKLLRRQLAVIEVGVLSDEALRALVQVQLDSALEALD